jgi:hypothetical protein
MVGTRHKSSQKRQLPEWMIKDKRYLKDASNPDKKPDWYVHVKSFNTAPPARRFANTMEDHNRRAKLIEVVNERTKKPVVYRVYIRDLRK